MHYKVFMDTNIYDGSNYSFRNDLFSHLKEYAKHGNLELQINSVVKGEVRKHIKKKIKESAKDLNQILSGRNLVLFRNIPEYNERMLTLSPNDWVDTALAEFYKLLQACNAEEISSNAIDVEKIISDYFELKYPFEQEKKDEFPDAITVQAIASEVARLSKGDVFAEYNNDDLIYCVVSADNGFTKAIKDVIGERSAEDVKFFASLNELIGFFATQDKHVADLQDKINTGYLKDLIETTIKDGLDCAEFVVDDPEGCVEEVYNKGTGDYNYDAYVIGLQAMSDGTKVARIYLDVSFGVMLEYSYLNFDRSAWDREEKTYLWEVITDVLANFKSSVSIVFTVSINEDDVAEFLDYAELPSLIEVDTDDMEELISEEDRDRRP